MDARHVRQPTVYAHPAGSPVAHPGARLMPHEDFDGEITTLADEHDEAEEAMRAIVMSYQAGIVTPEEAEAAIVEIGDALKLVIEDWIDDVMPQVYADGVAQARAEMGETGEIPEVDHAALLGLAQRRLERRLTHAADGLTVDALDHLDEAVESVLAPLRSAEPVTEEAQ
jgi:hypothetical protein